MVFQKFFLLRCFAIAACLMVSWGCGEQKSKQVAAVASSESPVATAVNIEGAEPVFLSPVRFVSPEGAVRVEAPGYASPSWADLDGDGTSELLVGQFSGGKIRVFKSLGGEKVDKGEWLHAGGNVAEVPGVW